MANDIRRGLHIGTEMSIINRCTNDNRRSPSQPLPVPPKYQASSAALQVQCAAMLKTSLPNTPSGGTPDAVLTVSQLNRLARQLLEDCFPMIWVEGEISNLSRPSSGHWYFTL